MREDIITSLFGTCFVNAQNTLYDTNEIINLFRGYFGVKIASDNKHVIYRYQK